MYAVIATGGKQYKVSEGETFRIERIPGEIGEPVSFDRVLMFSDGKTVEVGQPILTDVAVTGAGGIRHATGLWPHEDASAEIPSEVSDITMIA